MWVCPFEFYDRSRHGDGLLGIEHGEGMMCQCWRRQNARRNGCKAKSFEFHQRLPEHGLADTRVVVSVIILQVQTEREAMMRSKALIALAGLALAAMTMPAEAAWKSYVSHALGFSFDRTAFAAADTLSRLSVRTECCNIVPCW
jgi:hypothetical protein